MNTTQTPGLSPGSFAERSEGGDFEHVLLARAGSLLASSLDFDATLGAVAKLVVPTLSDWFVIHVLDENGSLTPAITMHADPARLAVARDYQQRFPPDAATSTSARVSRSGKPEIIPVITDEMLRAAARDDEHLRSMRELGMTSAIVVPLLARGKHLGAMTLVAAESGRRYTEQDLHVAEELALRIAAAMDTARLFAAERAAVERTSRLQAVTAGLARALTIEDVAHIVVREGMGAFQARDGLLCLTSADGEWLEIVHQIGLPEETTREFRRFPVFASLPLSDAVGLREPLFFESKAVVQTRYPVLREANARAATEAWVALPLLSGDTAVGGLAFGFAEARPFSPEDRALCVTLAQQCVLAIERARLLASERAARTAAERSAERTARLQAVAAALLDTDTPAAVADVILRETLPTLRADAGFVARATGDGMLDVVGSRGYPVEVLSSYGHFALSAAYPASEAARLGNVIWLPTRDARRDRYPHLSGSPATKEFESWLFVPLTAHGATVGVLSLAFRYRRVLDEREHRFALGVAQQCAQALERADLFESERRARATAERLQSLTAGLSEAVRYSEIGEVVMRHGVTPLGAYAGVIALLTPDGSELELLASVGYPPDACMSVGKRWPLAAAMPIAEAARTGAPVYVESPKQWGERYLGGKTPHGGRSAAWAAVPLGGERSASGALLWTFEDPRRFRDDERELMAAIARQCSQALDRARLFESEQVARARADEANRAKTEFLAVMSHELRTPLNAIAGYTELLTLGVHGPLTDAQRDALGRIQRSQRHLLGLINDVLNFARIDSAHVDLRITAVRLDDTLSVLETLVAPQLEAKQLRYAYLPCDADVRVSADPEKLDQILLNLLSNAIKFTAPGGRIAVSCAVDAEHVSIAVADSGQGIPADKLERIFEPFFQIDNGTTRAHEGTGLGLAISRDLARAMHGDIGVESAFGAGSTFTVVLPRLGSP